MISSKVLVSGERTNTFIASCDSSVEIYDAVYFSGFSFVSKSLADKIDLIKSNSRGIVEYKINSTLCSVRFAGKMLITGLTEGEYFLSSILPGKMVLGTPSSGVIKKLGTATGDGTFIVNVEELIRIKN